MKGNGDLVKVLNAIGTLVHNLRDTHREVTDKNRCRDIVKLAETCHPDIRRNVADEIKRLDTSEAENPDKVQETVKAAILAADGRS